MVQTKRTLSGALAVICLATFFLVTLFDGYSAATVGRKPIQSATNTNQGKGKTNKGNVIHPTFANAGRTPGLEIWRIEQFEPVAYPKNDYGKFHTGDSYIVLFTKETGGKLSWDIYFWLGTETTQDESAAAAILTVQLDDQLGGVPVQHRELQEHESSQFKAHFKNLKYAPGGVAGALRHVDTAAQKKLYQVKGKKNIRVKQVELSVAGMNKGDCFVLDAGNEILVYHGPASKRVERLKAVSAANLIRDTDHGGRPKISILDETSNQDEMDHFFSVLGVRSGSIAKIPDESAGGDDQQFEKLEETVVSLHKVSDVSGKMKVDKLTQKPIKQEMMDTNDCFILDTDQADVYVWVGKKCNPKERTEAMSKGESLIKSKHYPSWTKVQKVIEGAEPSVFRQYFATWKGWGELHTRLIRDVSNSNDDEQCIPNTSQLWHCKLQWNGKLIIQPLNTFEQGDLADEDVMILDDGCRLFVWFGMDSEDDERRASIAVAKSHFKRISTIDVIKQKQEPAEFVSMFQNWNPDFWDNAPSYEERINEIIHS